jgi:predicted O-linked N-acetylglucosamine transferase (SPINDLY family)
LNALVATGFGQLQRGEFPEAERTFRSVLASHAQHTPAIYGLAATAYGVRRYDLALDIVDEAIRRAPAEPMQHYLRGRVLARLERREEAIAALERTVSLAPRFAPGHLSLGVVHKQRGDAVAAIAAYREALRLDPGSIEAYANLDHALQLFVETMDERERTGLARWLEAEARRTRRSADGQLYVGSMFERLGDIDAARACFSRAAELAPDLGDRENSAASGLRAAADFDAALAARRRAAQLRPNNAEAQLNLGMALREAGRHHEAIDAFRRVVELHPDHFDAYRELSLAMNDLGQNEAAVFFADSAVRIRPESGAAHVVLALARYHGGDYDAAREESERAVALHPEHPEGLVNLANSLLMLRRQDEALQVYERAAALVGDSGDVIVEQNRLMAMNYSERVAPGELLAAHRAFGTVAAARVVRAPLPFANVPDAERRLRVGYVSPDFRNHSVSFFFEPIVEHQDRSGFEVYCYASSAAVDAVTDRLRARADGWLDCKRIPDDLLARRIRDDRIDILVDLAGHTGDNRSLVALHRAAPLQMTYLGYPTITGLPEMDYRLTDAHVDPPAEDDPAATFERPLRLPASYFCYRPGHERPVAPLPALATGSVTFGSFNNVAKITDGAIDLWSRVLSAVPGGRLVLKNRGFRNQSVCEGVRVRFTERGVDPARLELVDWSATGEQHHDWYDRVDIALDSFPYAGATTTCEALWKGVPVISLAGGSHASRMGRSILAAADLRELCASSDDEYVSAAARLAGDLAALAAMRGALRERLRASPLMDEAGFVRGLEALYRRAWADWCTGQRTP